MNIDDQVAKVAYSIYEKNVKNDGYDLDNWIEAERVVLDRKHQQQVEESNHLVKNTRTSNAGSISI